MSISVFDLRRQLESRRAVLRQAQSVALPVWRDIRQFIQPFRGRFDGERPNQHSPDMTKIIRSKMFRAKNILVSGMQSGMTSQSRQWFKISVPDPDLAEFYSVRAWCDEVHDRIMRVLPGANFYRSALSVYDELASFGTGAVSVVRDFENVARFKAYTCGRYYAGLGVRDRVDTIYRDFWMSAYQLVTEFGYDNCSLAVRDCSKTRPDTMFAVRHAVEPDTSPGAKFPYHSVYWEEGGDGNKVLRISGFNLFPAMIPRWDVMEDEIYGYGPGTVILPDCKSLQKKSSSELLAIDKQVNPPLQVAASLRGSNVRTTPNGITYVPDTPSGVLVAPIYDTNVNLSYLKESINETIADINEGMYVDLFLMLTNTTDANRTAYEVAELQQEKMQVLGPVLDRLTDEFLTPAIESVFSFMSDAGLIPEPPEELEGMELKIEYVSILAQAQKMMGLKPMEQLLSFTGSLAQAAPQVIDIINADQAVRSYCELVGAPVKVLRRQEDVDAIRQQQAEAMQKQQQNAEIAQIAASGQQAAQGAKLLSEVDMGPDTALNALLGTANI